jgi:hypothetical protein
MFDITRGYSLVKLCNSKRNNLFDDPSAFGGTEELASGYFSSRFPMGFRGNPFILAIFSRSNINQQINIKHIDAYLVGGLEHF